MSEMTQAELTALAAEVYTPNYRPAPIVFERGEGAWLYDREGARYLDFTAGIAVCALGHGHPDLARALGEQASDLLHVSNLYFNRHAILLAKELVDLSFGDRVYFSNSGAEANEAALKLARRYQQVIRGNERSKFVCANLSFHGRTWAAISATGQPKYHKGFGPLVPGFVHVPYNDIAAMREAVDDETCAVLIEPIQGEGGIVVPDEGYLESIRELCDERGALLIFDEVQTGVGRTGQWFAYQHSSIAPDIMTLAKGLGGGVPIGAMVCTEEVAPGFQPGVHASTFGGNPLVCRAARTVIDVIQRDRLLENVHTCGAEFAAGLQELVDDIPGLLEVRGRGLMLGLGVDPEQIDRADIMARSRTAGLLLTTAGPDALRFVPPLNIGSAHVQQALEILGQILRGD